MLLKRFALISLLSLAATLQAAPSDFWQTYLPKQTEEAPKEQPAKDKKEPKKKDKFKKRQRRRLWALAGVAAGAALLLYGYKKGWHFKWYSSKKLGELARNKTSRKHWGADKTNALHYWHDLRLAEAVDFIETTTPANPPFALNDSQRSRIKRVTEQRDPDLCYTELSQHSTTQQSAYSSPISNAPAPSAPPHASTNYSADSNIAVQHNQYPPVYGAYPPYVAYPHNSNQ